MAINPSLHRSINKAMAPSGYIPMDYRSMYYDELFKVYRAYQNQQEVFDYINQTILRTSDFAVVINTGGTLSNGVITGGTNALYFFDTLTTLAPFSSQNLTPWFEEFTINGSTQNSVTLSFNPYLVSQITIDKVESLASTDWSYNSTTKVITFTNYTFDAKDYFIRVDYFYFKDKSLDGTTDTEEVKSLAQSVIETYKNTVNGFPTINSDGKIDSSVLPDVATKSWISSTQSVTPTNTTTVTFDLPSTPDVNTLSMDMYGTTQILSSDYTLSGTTVTLTGGYEFDTATTVVINYKYQNA